MNLQFGDSQKLSMVRITDGAVSLRIRRGWESLEEFLSRHKTDQCNFHESAENTTRNVRRAEGLEETETSFS